MPRYGHEEGAPRPRPAGGVKLHRRTAVLGDPKVVGLGCVVEGSEPLLQQGLAPVAPCCISST
jgi:hypothetical protein